MMNSIHTLPPAPPPPPKPPPEPSGKTVPCSDLSKVTIVADWSNIDDEAKCFSVLWQSAQRHLTTEDPKLYKFTFIQGVQQIGPTCGLAALYMVAKHLNVDVSSQRIFELAVGKEMTAFGEMFCAKKLCQLAQEVLGSKAEVTLNEGELELKIPGALFHDHLILIPYDTDKNNEPCLQQGKKAHWAILCGIVKTENRTFVLARQSKSRLISVWSLEKLVESNSNLSITDEKVRSGSIVPAEGLTRSLAKQCIVIKKK